MRKGGYACGIQQVHQRHDPRRRGRGLLHTQVRQPQGGRQRQAIPDRSAQRPYRHDGTEGLGLCWAADRRRRGHRGQGAGYRGEYRGTPQFTAGRIRPAAQEDPVDVSALVPTAPIDCGAAMEDLRRAAASITDPDYRAMAEAMLEAHGRRSRPSPPPRAYTMPSWAAC